MREVIIASSVRTPVGRAFKGTLSPVYRRSIPKKLKMSSSAAPCPRPNKG